MKQLIILRHGQAQSMYLSDNDFLRKLTNKGKNDAHKMAEYLQEHTSNTDTILTSSANRAIETAQIIANILTPSPAHFITKKTLYLASSHKLISEIQSLNDQTITCLLVGHNPGLTDLINQLDVRMDDLPTASAVCFSFETNSWQNILQANAKFEWVKISE